MYAPSAKYMPEHTKLQEYRGGSGKENIIVCCFVLMTIFYSKRASLRFWTQIDPEDKNAMLEELQDPNSTRLGLCCINNGY